MPWPNHFIPVLEQILLGKNTKTNLFDESQIKLFFIQVEFIGFI